MSRITGETAVTTLVDADVLLVDNPTLGTRKIAHSNLKAQYEQIANKGVASGYASLGADGLVPATQLQPSFTAEEVADAAARNALTVIAGEVGKRLVRLADTGVYYIAIATGSGASKWQVYNSIATASTSAAGAVELATNAEAATGTDTVRAITPAAMKAGLADELNARAFGQRMVFATSTATLSGPVLGASDFTIAAWFKSNLDNDRWIIADAAGDSLLQVRATGQLDWYSNNTRTYSPVGSVVANEEQFIVVRRTGGVTSLMVNNQEVASVQPADTQAIAALTRIGGSAPLLGSLYLCVFNRCLTAAQVQSLMKHGVDAADVPPQLAGTSLITGDSSTFTGSAGLWSANGSGVTATWSTDHLAVSGIGVEYGGCKLLSDIWIAGKMYRVAFTISNLTGTGDLYLIDGGGDTIPGSTAFGNGSHVFDITATPNQAAGQALFIARKAGSAVTAFDLDSVTAIPIGTVLYPEPAAPGNGLVWNDVSGNGAHIVLPTSGVSWAKPSNAANRIRGTTITNGNQAMLGNQTLVPANTQITRIRARSRSGTPTIRLGTTQGGSDVVSSIAISTTWKSLTVALTDGIVSAAINIWVNSTSTDVVEIDIAWEPLSF